MPNKQHVLITLLDGLYREIDAIETERALTWSGDDLRRPVDYYHDAVRALLQPSGPLAARLSVAAITADVDSLRRRTAELRAQGAAFFAAGEADAAAMIAHKRCLIRDSESLLLPLPVAVEELMEFAASAVAVAPEDAPPPTLDDTLAARQAMKLAEGERGHWLPLEAEEFRRHLAAALQSWVEQFGGVIENPLQAQSLPTERDATRNYSRERTAAALKALWVQITHPANLWRAMRPADQRAPGHAWEYDPEAAITESAWQADDREARHLAETYARYTVMFAALLAETVDTDYKDTLSGLQEKTRAAAELLAELDALAPERELPEAELEAMTAHGELLDEIRHILQHRQRLQRLQARDAAEAVRENMRAADHGIAALEAAHFAFLTSQLAVYEASKDVVKQLAMQGFNLAGKFVQTAAAQETQRGRGGKGR